MYSQRKILISLVFCAIVAFPSTTAADVSDEIVIHKMESDFQDGTFVNGTLNITGTITSDSTDIEWKIYDSSNFDYLHSGSYFSEVIPISVGRWDWSLQVDVSFLSCACILEITHGVSELKSDLIIEKMVFIGDGPFSPIIIPDSEFVIDSEMTDDADFGLNVRGIVANGELNESTIITNYCKVTSGHVCDDSTNSSIQSSINWTGHEGMLIFNSRNLSLTEGEWWFAVSLRDSNLLHSSFSFTVPYKVDLNPPNAVLIAVESVNESSTIILDGSSSDDGIWTSYIQAVWYITEPDGTVRNPSIVENKGLSLLLEPKSLGNWIVRLEVIDFRGRISSANCTFEVVNVAPQAFINLDELDLNDHVYRMPQWADWSLDATESYDAADDYTMLRYRWYVNDVLVSNISILDVSELELKPGEHRVILQVIDTGGAIGNSSMILEVYADENESAANPVMAWLTISLVIIVLLILIVIFIQYRGGKSLSVPRWKDTRKSDSQEDDGLLQAMWDDNNPE